ncbi:hypothetical protein A2U01_0114394, partial [Trifolium medium]|nr:hypothetical protein [Trifolium medium]
RGRGEADLLLRAVHRRPPHRRHPVHKGRVSPVGGHWLEESRASQPFCFVGGVMQS